MLDTRHARSIEALKDWLYAASAQTLASPDNIAPTIPPSATLQAPVAWLNDADAVISERTPMQAMVTKTGSEAISKVQGTTGRTPSRLPTVADPFSPDLFNRLNLRQ
jgi:hypothetical protein